RSSPPGPGWICWSRSTHPSANTAHVHSCHRLPGVRVGLAQPRAHPGLLQRPFPGHRCVAIMTILFRYVARDFFKNWLGTLTALIVLIIIAALFGNIDEAFSSWESFLEFYDKTVKSMPGLIEILLPMTVLLSTVLTFSAFSRT